MKITEIKAILERKLARLQEQKNFAYQAGDLEEYAKIESEITETQLALNSL